MAEAPGSVAFCRVLCDGFGADWPLSRKFGCAPDLGRRLCCVARAPRAARGVSFHVGSQQRDPTHGTSRSAWSRHPSGARAAGDRAELVNLGGGLPGTYARRCRRSTAYGAAFARPSNARFGPTAPARCSSNPAATSSPTPACCAARWCSSAANRPATSSAGCTSMSASSRDSPKRWMRRSATGLPDAADGGPTGPVAMAGPTCDSADMLYEKSATSCRSTWRGRHGRPPVGRRVLHHLQLDRLQRLPPARRRSPAVTDRLADVLAPLVERGVRRRYPLGALIFAEGDRSSEVLVVTEGVVHLVVGFRSGPRPRGSGRAPRRVRGPRRSPPLGVRPRRDRCRPRRAAGCRRARRDRAGRRPTSTSRRRAPSVSTRAPPHGSGAPSPPVAFRSASSPVGS